MDGSNSPLIVMALLYLSLSNPRYGKNAPDAQANYPVWVAAITGKMGELTGNGFVLLEPNVQNE
jgi:hypothetical protein